MTTAYLNRYGGMKPVDEVKRPDVKEDAAATLSSAFIVWRQMASVVMDNRRMYQSSVDFLQPYKGMLEGLHDASPLVQFRRGLPPSSPSDCFFAAVLNLSGVAVFADDFNDWFSPGYLLPEGKTLIALPGSDTRNLGEGAKGKVYNLGFTESLGHGAVGAVLVNKKIAEEVGTYSEYCTCINDGEAWKVGMSSFEGIHINLFPPVFDRWRLALVASEVRRVQPVKQQKPDDARSVRRVVSEYRRSLTGGRLYAANSLNSINRVASGSLGYCAEEAVAINLGRLHEPMAYNAVTTLSYSGNPDFKWFEERGSWEIYDNCIFFITTDKGVLRHRYDVRKGTRAELVSPGATLLLKSLEAKVNEAVAACRAGSVNETIRSMVGYDWAGFKAEVQQLRSRIEEAVKE